MVRHLLLYSLLSQLCFSAFTDVSAAVCFPEWKHNRAITVTNTNTSAYTDFQVKLIVNTQALIAAGKMQNGGQDIRFSDGACNNLHYWIDSNLNTTTTVIWVKVNSLAASGNTTIYMYYGNPCAAAAQNGDSTFIQFDDFNGTTLDMSKWEKYGDTAVVSGGRLRINGNISLMLRDSLNIQFRSEIKVTNLQGNAMDLMQVNSTYRNYQGYTQFHNTLGNTRTYGPNQTLLTGLPLFYCCNAGFVAQANFTPNEVWGVTWIATGSQEYNIGGGIVTHNNGTYTRGTWLKTALAHVNPNPAYFFEIDWIRNRKYAPTEPGSSIGTENTQGMTITFSPSVICPGSPISIVASKNGIFFDSLNVFSYQLSDSNGNFSTPFVLGTKTDSIPDTILLEMPKNVLPGNSYRIRITTTNPAYSCFTSTQQLTVLPKPNPSYTFPNDSQCFKYNNYQFTSTSTISSGSIDSFIWSWDDGSLSDTLTTPGASHSFRAYYFYYYPKLTVISNLGCRDSVSRQVNLRETPEIVTVFNDTIQCFKGNFFIIESETETLTGSINFKSWDLGDGSPALFNTDSFTHSYASEGIFQVRQINNHTNGCRDTAYLACLVNTHPTAIISTNDTDQCILGNEFIFESLSTITNGLPLLNYWDIGENITRDDQDSVHHTYSSPSVINVELITISDDGLDGCADTANQEILINPMPVAAINNLDIEKCFNYNLFRFKANSTISSGSMVHHWDFGDLSTDSTKDSVAHSYAADGIFTVKMTSVSDKGCIDSASTSITIRPSPVPSFYFNADTQCYKYHAVKAYSTSSITSGTISKHWFVSDGMDFLDVDSIHHTFSAFGNYEVMLTLTSDYNCRDTAIDSVSILPMPVSSFTVDDEDQCLEGNIFTFTDNSVFSQGTITGNQWLFDDGTGTLNLQNVSHTYTAENAYVPGLIVFGDNGCFDTSFQNIKVYPHPGSDFFINDTGQCVNDNNFVFTNNTFISEGGFINRWFFGDGSPFVDAFSTTKKYTKDSTYLVRIISFSDQGCTDTAEKTVTVFPKATTGFIIDNPQQCFLGNLFTYTSTTTLKSGTYTLAWQYGDGTGAGNVNTTQKFYTNVQQYNPRLISTTNEGCKDTITRQVRTLAMPDADYTTNYTQSCLLGNDFQFNATSSVSGNVPMNHNWYFGDNDSAINSSFTQHTYSADGSYTVRLISSTNVGNCKDTLERTVLVHPMPAASFTIDDDRQCFKDHGFNFTSTSSVSSGIISQTNWRFGDNTTSALPDPFKTYNRVDSFRVKLEVVTNNGCVDSISRKVYIYPMPVADFSINPASACLENNLFRITNKSNIVNGNITRYVFQYGNGDSSTLKDPAPYTYPVEGTFPVTLRVTTDFGCWDTASAEITVNPDPELDFTVDPVCLKDSSVFINNSTLSIGNVVSWKWLFGNGRVSTLQSPKTKYRDVGTYDITLIAVTDQGCNDTLFKPGEAIVHPNPKAGFFYTKEKSWEKDVDVQYTDTSSGAVSWNWDFADMGISTDQHPKLYYKDTITQVTTLVVTNTFGCRDTVVKILFIAPDVTYYMPSAFTPQNDDGLNETFKPVGLAFAINYKFIIFNRWGEILFSTDNPQIGWDGTYNGSFVPQDLYFYRLEFVGVDELRHEVKGNLMILH